MSAEDDLAAAAIAAAGNRGMVAHHSLVPERRVAERRETINHPDHYGGDTTYEAIKVIEAWGLGFCIGNTVKYLARAGRKDPSKHLEDLRKARWYLDREIARLEAEVKP